jgi:regulator of extracellular matrix RemA (YlzA/DUF370 family)
MATTKERPYVAPVTGHCPANATYRGHTDTDSHGRRHHWTIPSTSQPGVIHDCWAGPGGEEPHCTCKSYQARATCGMVEGLPVLLTAVYRERTAKATEGALLLAAENYYRRERLGSLTMQDRLIWSAIQDESLARMVAFEARQLLEERA